MTDEEFPFAAHRHTLDSAIAGRKRIITKVVCERCNRTTGNVYDSPVGAVYYAQFALPSNNWLIAEPKDLQPNRVPYPSASSADLVEWEGDRPPRTLTARCDQHGDLVVHLTDLMPAVARYRQAGKVQRVVIHPRGSPDR